MSVLTTVRDALWPQCSVCSKRFFVVFDKSAELQQLKAFGEYRPEYDRYFRLCGQCWMKIVTVPCDLCRTPFNVLENQLTDLTKNLKAHSVQLDELANARRVCPRCSAQRIHCVCSRCSKAFPASQDRATAYKSSADVQKWLAPYHKDYQTTWARMCPVCFQACLDACKDVKSRLAKWVGGTKGEYIRGFRTVQTIGRVEYAGRQCDEPEKVEAWLRLYAVQVGGNAFVKYYWEKHEERHSRRVIAGYGPKGNPYYRTESWTERWFTGYATAVVVEPFPQQHASSRRMTDVPISQQVKHIVLDGLNVCCWANRNRRQPDLRILLTLCAELCQQGLAFVVFFDANTPHLLRQMNDTDAETAYRRLVGGLPQFFVEVPGRIRADEFLLQRANSDNSHIISNDQFREFTERYPWLISGERLIKGTVAGGRLTIPQLDLDLRIMPDAVAVADRLVQTIAQQQGSCQASKEKYR